MIEALMKEMIEEQKKTNVLLAEIIAAAGSGAAEEGSGAATEGAGEKEITDDELIAITGKAVEEAGRKKVVALLTEYKVAKSTEVKDNGDRAKLSAALAALAKG